MSEIRVVNGDEVRNLRISVFADEQGYPVEKLFDEYDNTAGYLALLMRATQSAAAAFIRKRTKFSI